MKRTPLRCLSILLLLGSGCTGNAARSPAAAPRLPPRAGGQQVVLVSLDGFRWDYLQRPFAVNLRRLAGEGVHAERMSPVFPSLTFPNHYSIVTGLYPEHHGIVSNTMFDSALGTFRISDTSAVRNPAWWGGEPIWVTAEKQGVRAGAFFWPGSEAGQGGVRPTRWLRFNDRFPNRARVDSVLDWLTLPGDQALRMITLYYSDVDHAGHSYGPAAPQVDSAIARVDTMIGALMVGIASRGLADRVDVIVVSDHGMTSTPADRSIFLDDYLNLDDVTIVDLGTLGQLIPKAGKLDEVYAALHAKNPHMAVYRKPEIPARFHYRDNPRITPIVIVPDTGFTLTTHARFAWRKPPAGEHGFDNLMPTMGATFIAAGPAFRQGVTVPPFQNIHVYDLLCRLLGIRPAANDGSLDSTAAMLRR
ncbi:MAG: ectonucleotide pyrophosphatase/phosphodiesterase [Gemmatimonadales bacterium]